MNSFRIIELRKRSSSSRDLFHHKMALYWIFWYHVIAKEYSTATTFKSRASSSVKLSESFEARTCARESFQTFSSFLPKKIGYWQQQQPSFVLGSL